MDRRTRRELEQFVAERLDVDVFYESLLALLERGGLRYDGACWHVNDPVTGLLARTGAIGDLPGDFHTAIHLELFEDDVAKMDEVARRKVPVTSLVHETGGRPRRGRPAARRGAPHRPLTGTRAEGDSDRRG